MSRRSSKRSNIGSSEAASSSHRGGRRAPPPDPVEEEEECIDADAYVVPDCKYGIRVVPGHARLWFRTFVPAVSPDLEVGIDDGKLVRKYSGIYNNIRYLGFETLFRPGESVNVNMVKEFYANWQPEASLNAVPEFVRVEETLQLLFADICLRADRGEIDMAELQENYPLSAVTQQLLGLADGVEMPPDEDANSIPSDDEKYMRTFEGVDEE
ncbi:hypothetical protein A4A49_00652 [Nicotiana attenuata]|uniref:Uncharacterized protein n=1 Tax=Nicotiana attenuata TaxID=49451 RepID=A0A314LFQ9_NICAT|nr:hypothetical protein A4A49_00652 [Nicotiana attenuata]